MRRLVWLLLMGMLTSPLPAQESPQQILDRAIQAQGGAAALARTRLRVRSSRGEIITAFGTSSFLGELTVQLPDQARWSFELEVSGQKLPVRLVVNGDQGWRSGVGTVKEMGQEELAERRAELYVMWLTTLLPLRDPLFVLTALPEAKVEDRPVVGFQVSKPGHADVKLFFDKQTHFLVKAEHKARQGGTEVLREHLWSEYKDFDGVKMPAREVDRTNGQTTANLTVTAYRFPAKLAESVFAKP